MKEKNKIDRWLAKLLSFSYIPLLLVCRFSYLYFAEDKTLSQALRQTGIETGNFTIITIFGLAVILAYLFIRKKIIKKN